MIKRVCSRNTKLLFIAFGALSIAALCIVYSADVERALTPQHQLHYTLPVKPLPR